MYENTKIYNYENMKIYKYGNVQICKQKNTNVKNIKKYVKKVNIKKARSGYSGVFLPCFSMLIL